MVDVLVAPDGALYRLGRPLPDFAGSWGFISWLDRASGRVRINSGKAGSNEVVANLEAVGEPMRIREASYQSGLVICLEYLETGQTLFVWRAAYHELYVSYVGLDVPMEAFGELLQSLDLRDSEGGLLIKPIPGSGIALETQTAVNYVAEAAAVQIFPTASVRHALPKHRGREVRGGELWRMQYGDTLGALIANDSAVVQLRSMGDERRLVDLAEELLVTIERQP